MNEIGLFDPKRSCCLCLSKIDADSPCHAWPTGGEEDEGGDTQIEVVYAHEGCVSVVEALDSDLLDGDEPIVSDALAELYRWDQDAFAQAVSQLGNQQESQRMRARYLGGAP